MCSNEYCPPGIIHRVYEFGDFLCSEHLGVRKTVFLFRRFPEYEAYKVPKFFSSDWMNEFWDAKGDEEQGDYRFLYFGVKGSW